MHKVKKAAYRFIFWLFLVSILFTIANCRLGSNNVRNNQNSSQKAITPFSIAGTPGVIIGHNISVTVPYSESNVTNFI